LLRKRIQYITLSTNLCPECGQNNLVEDYEMGEIICQDCGLVILENLVDKGPEWRAFTREERQQRSRVGTPSTLSVHDKGLSTIIDQVNKDAFGKELAIPIQLQMLRLRKWQIRARVHSSIDRNLSQAMTELDRLSDKLQIPTAIKEQAALLYRNALNKGLVRGRSILAITAASLYAACRFTRTPRTLKEVSKVSYIRQKDIARCYRLLIRVFNLHMPVIDPILCVPKIASRIQINEKLQQIAIHVLHKADEKKVVAGKDPMGLAAAALYISCVLERVRKTQKEIAIASGVTEVTVRNRYKGLRDVLHLNI
jgi:transcription initiation factor TFIIB